MRHCFRDPIPEIYDAARLFETPFSNYHGQGVVGVLGNRAKQVIDIVTDINSNAEVA